jgi:DNA-binding SARP family transcriptional activator
MKGHAILPARACEIDPSRFVISPSHRTANPPRRKPTPSTRILLLDGIAIASGTRQIVLGNRKASVLLAYLALTRGMRESRERLIGLLWSETEPSKARASLRQLLYWLRETFEQQGLRGLAIDKQHVSLDPAAFATDLDLVFQAIALGHPTDLAASEMCITDTIMSGYDDVDPSVLAWLRVMREKLRRRMMATLEDHLSDAPGSVERTKRAARALLQMDPAHEVACQHLMRALIKSGNTAGALAAYSELWEYLEQTFDIEPSPTTQALVVSIRTRDYLFSGLPESQHDMLKREIDGTVSSRRPPPPLGSLARSVDFVS